MPAIAKKIRTVNVKKTVIDRTKSLDLSAYALVQKLKGKVPERTVYRFLDPDSDGAIRSSALGHILDALGLTIQPKK